MKIKFLFSFLLAFILSFTIVTPAFALDLNPSDYFQIDYEPVTFDKSEVTAGETFHAILKGRADCIKDLPLPISKIRITSKVAGRPSNGGPDITLNNEYIIDINPLPNKAGATFDISQSVPLQFPADTEPGEYAILAQLSEAIVTGKVLFFEEDVDVTGSFPQEQAMGSVKVIVQAEPAASPVPIQETTSSAAPPEPTVTSPTPAPVPPEPAQNGSNTLLIIVVIVLTAAVIVLAAAVIILFSKRHSG